MAGLDGIKNKIHPGEASDKDLYDLPPEELAGIPTVCASLREALDELQADHDYLLAGDVFTKDQIDAYAELRRAVALEPQQRIEIVDERAQVGARRRARPAQRSLPDGPGSRAGPRPRRT